MILSIFNVPPIKISYFATIRRIR